MAADNSGTIGILNVGAGDTKLVFDKDSPADCIRAARIVKDMLRRGYALIIKTGEVDGKPTYQRALDFREDTFEYIIADLDPIAADQADRTESHQHEQGIESAAGEAAAAQAGAQPTLRGGRRKTRAIAATRTSGTAVARTAGG
jgi:hypothetical protein